MNNAYIVMYYYLDHHGPGRTFIRGDWGDRGDQPPIYAQFSGIFAHQRPPGSNPAFLGNLWAWNLVEYYDAKAKSVEETFEVLVSNLTEFLFFPDTHR